MAISLERFTVGPLLENCYLLSTGAEAVLIDPGDEGERLNDALSRAGLRLTAIWLTHAHFDHVGGVEAVWRRHPVPVLLHPADRPLYDNAQQAAEYWGIPFEQPSAPTTDLAPGQVLKVGGQEVHCLFTPGHAPGHIAFHVPSEGLVLAGDALFQGSIGRSDLPFGDHAALLESIRRELLTLPDDTRVYPGHGPETTIGAERAHNPFLS